MDFDFYMPAKIVSGHGCVKENASELKIFGTCCGIVTGGSSARKSGVLSDVLEAIEINGQRAIVFEGITPNPLTSDCLRAAQLFAAEKVDFIVGIGGGSPQDSAKAIAALTVNLPQDGNPDSIYDTDFINNKPLPIVLVGTSSGTGSEVSKVAVLTNTVGRKRSINAPSLYASLVFADSGYTNTMPYDVTVSTALDALSHAVEGFMTKKCTDIISMFAYKGIPMLWKNLTEMLDNGKVPSDNGREELYYGSLYAGIVLNACGTVFPHPLGYVLTENYGIPHGKACSAFMPALIKRAENYSPEKVELLMKMLGTNTNDFCRTVTQLTALPEIRMTKEELLNYCERWSTAPKNFVASPGGFTSKDASAVMEKLFIK